MRYLAVASVMSVVVLAGHLHNAPTAVSRADDACAMLTPADIAKALSWKVSGGVAGKPIPGVLGHCTWTTSDNAHVIVTLADARHIAFTMQTGEGSGAKAVPGIGTKAVSVNAGGLNGWIVTVADAKGGFGLSVLGGPATEDNALALARIVESRR